MLREKLGARLASGSEARGFRVWGLGFRVSGPGFRFRALGFWVYLYRGLGFTVRFFLFFFGGGEGLEL